MQQTYGGATGPSTDTGPAPVHTADLVREQQERERLASSTAADGEKNDVGLGLQNNNSLSPPETTTLPSENTNVDAVSSMENDPLSAPKTDSPVGALDQSGMPISLSHELHIASTD